MKLKGGVSERKAIKENRRIPTIYFLYLFLEKMPKSENEKVR